MLECNWGHKTISLPRSCPAFRGTWTIYRKSEDDERLKQAELLGLFRLRGRLLSTCLFQQSAQFLEIFLDQRTIFRLVKSRSGMEHGHVDDPTQALGLTVNP